jgi:hypothetical protein
MENGLINKQENNKGETKQRLDRVEKLGAKMMSADINGTCAKGAENEVLRVKFEERFTVFKD